MLARTGDAGVLVHVRVAPSLNRRSPLGVSIGLTSRSKAIAFWTADNILGERVPDGYGEYRKKSIEEKATELFDLTRVQADRLFDGSNTLDELWKKAEQISAGEITSSKEWYWSDYNEALREKNVLEMEKARQAKAREAAKVVAREA